jgi:hypothetical protein
MDCKALVFHNRESRTRNIKVNVCRDSVASLMAWYGAYYAGDTYTVSYDGRNVPMDQNGEPVGDIPS